MDPRGPTPTEHCGPVMLDTFVKVVSTSFVAFDVTIHPATASSGPVAAPNNTVVKRPSLETPSAVGAENAGPVGALLPPSRGGAKALSTPVPSNTALPSPLRAQQGAKATAGATLTTSRARVERSISGAEGREGRLGVSNERGAGEGEEEEGETRGKPHSSTICPLLPEG